MHVNAFNGSLLLCEIGTNFCLLLVNTTPGKYNNVDSYDWLFLEEQNVLSNIHQR